MREFIDDEFSYELYARFEKGDKLAGEALEWIAKYNNEYYRGVLKKDDPTALHNTQTLYKQATDAQNATRRDLIGAVKSGLMGSGAYMVQLADHPQLLDSHLNNARDLRHEEHMVELVGKKIKLKA